MAAGGGGGGGGGEGAGALLPVGGCSEMAAAAAAVKKEKWVVEYSRFFNFPSCSPPLFPSLRLKPLPKCKTRSGGTWITASSPAVLRLRKSQANPANPATAVLSVSVRRRIHEEHYISKLNISWPQVSCASECPIRGSRVIFFSYRDCSSQEISSNILDVGLPGRDFVCENSSPSENIASNGLKYRIDDDSSFVPPAVTSGPELAALTCKDDETECPLLPLLANNIETNFSGLPPSFPDLPANCSMEIQNEQSKPSGEAALTSQDEGCLLDASLNTSVTEVLNAEEPQRPVEEVHFKSQIVNAEEPQRPVEEVHFKSQIEQHVSDASFYDMLAKIEQVIDEFGGDMSL